jgi:hypothetical protein
MGWEIEMRFLPELKVIEGTTMEHNLILMKLYEAHNVCVSVNMNHQFHSLKAFTYGIHGKSFFKLKINLESLFMRVRNNEYLQPWKGDENLQFMPQFIDYKRFKTTFKS